MPPLPRRLLALPLCTVALVGCGTAKRHTAQPSPTATTPPRAVPDARPVPILMYHEIATPRAGVRSPGLYVSPSAFAAQVRGLAQAGYRAVTLERVFAAWHGRAKLPRRPIVLSFDDGYPSDTAVALPVLRARRWPGVLNLQVGNLVARNVKMLLAAGWEVDAHTFTHPNLTHVDATRLWREVNGSRISIRRTYGVPVDFFCYPSGRYDAAVVDAVHRAGYKAATTTRPGLARPTADPYTLGRIRVSRGESAATLLEELRSLEHRGA